MLPPGLSAYSAVSIRFVLFRRLQDPHRLPVTAANDNVDIPRHLFIKHGVATVHMQVRQLQQLVERNSDGAYQAICVTVEGEIDRDAAAKATVGFAADYDGLFTVLKVYGLCSDTTLLTQGDLQHHRWVLQSINGESLAASALHNVIPELEIGEQMKAFGNAGCNRFHGQAELRENRFIIEKAASTRMLCQPAQNDLERLYLGALGRESVITLTADKHLTLKTDEFELKFRLEDRMQ